MKNDDFAPVTLKKWGNLGILAGKKVISWKFRFHQNEKKRELF